MHGIELCNIQITAELMDISTPMNPCLFEVVSYRSQFSHSDNSIQSFHSSFLIMIEGLCPASKPLYLMTKLARLP